MRFYFALFCSLTSLPVMASTLGQQELFQRTAEGLVACYERVGTLQPQYGEDGLCAPDSELSAWLLKSHLSVASNLLTFAPLGHDNIGTYEGQVDFLDAEGGSCHFDMNVFYTGEDIRVRTSHLHCLNSEY